MIPDDKFRIAYIILIIHGVGILLPWNAFINAREYFMDYKLNTTESIEADYRVNLMNYFGFAAHVPSLLFAAWNTFCQVDGKQRNMNICFRILGSLLLEMVIFTCTILLIPINTSEIPGTFFFITVVSLVIVSCCVGVHQTLMFGLAAMLPIQYSTALIIGSNACGTIISTANIITKSLAMSRSKSNQTMVIAALAYFLFAIFITVTCFVTFIMLIRLKFVLYFMKQYKRDCSTKSDGEINDNRVGDEDDADNNSIHFTHQSKLISMNNNQQSVKENLLEKRSLVNENNTTSAEELEQTKLPDNNNNNAVLYGSEKEIESNISNVEHKTNSCCTQMVMKKTFVVYFRRQMDALKECWIQCMNIWCVLFCSLCIFPAIQSRIQLIDPDYFIASVWFVDVTCFLFFNLFGMLGCILCNWIQIPGPKYLWICVWLRLLIFVPFFMSCNFAKPVLLFPFLIRSDHVYVFGSVIFAFTNGYFSTLGIMYASKYCSKQFVQQTGMLASFAIILGVFSGVNASRLLVSLI